MLFFLLWGSEGCEGLMSSRMTPSQDLGLRKASECRMAKLNPHHSFKTHVIFIKLARIVEKGLLNQEKVSKRGVHVLVFVLAAPSCGERRLNNTITGFRPQIGLRMSDGKVKSPPFFQNPCHFH